MKSIVEEHSSILEQVETTQRNGILEQALKQLEPSLQYILEGLYLLQEATTSNYEKLGSVLKISVENVHILELRGLLDLKRILEIHYQAEDLL